MNKTIIRKEIYEKRRKLNKIFVETNSKNIFINLCKTKVFDFKNILVYSDFKNEVQTGDIIKSLLHDCGAIRRMLISSINTTKTNMTN